MWFTNKFAYRSNQKEMLDGPDIPFRLLYKNLRELDFLNRNTGGHAISLQGIKQLITDRCKIYHVVDLGCGSGDTLKTIADWARLNKYRVKLTGVDKNADTIEYLKTHCVNYPEIVGINADYYNFLNRIDAIEIVHCSLFCHHLDDDELFRLFTYFRQRVKIGFIINDLRRNRLAYYCTWFLTRLLKGSQLSKNDGPVSVLRGFKSVELSYFFSNTNIKNYTIQKKWIFRFLIIGKTENQDGKSG